MSKLEKRANIIGDLIGGDQVAQHCLDMICDEAALVSDLQAENKELKHRIECLEETLAGKFDGEPMGIDDLCKAPNKKE